jgi:formate dehydrogenase maturation protein FdhE
VNRQRVSNWVPTGSHSFCPDCGSAEVDVAYFVYSDNSKGWRFRCRTCGTGGPAELRKEAST